MLLRFLLSLLNPYGQGRLPRRKNFWLRCRISIFSFSVRRLQRRYRQYAYYDGINLGTIRVIHSCRDEVFESWLKAIGQDIRPHLVKNISLPEADKSQSNYRPFYKFFKFKRQLAVCQAGKELLIDRTSWLTISNEINGTFNISDETDILLRTGFKVANKIQNGAPIKEIVKDPIPPKPVVEKPPKQRGKVSLGKPIVNTTPPLVEPPQEDTSKKMRGVEVDESF